MNNIVIGVLLLAAITVIFLAIRLSVCKVKCKCKDKNPKDTQELIENAGKIVETLPPVDGPDAPPSVDHDNPYTITKNEPLVIAERMSSKRWPRIRISSNRSLRLFRALRRLLRSARTLTTMSVTMP